MMPLLGVGEAVDDCISAFPIWDPSKDTSHTGMSATAQAGALRSNQAFVRRFFWRVKQALQRARHQRKPSGVIAIYCRSGRHRSVALGEILAHCLRRDGYVVNSPSHLCDYWWCGVPCQKNGRKAGRRPWCTQCTSFVGDRKAELYAEADVEWRAA